MNNKDLFDWLKINGPTQAAVKNTTMKNYTAVTLFPQVEKSVELRHNWGRLMCCT